MSQALFNGISTGCPRQAHRGGLGCACFCRSTMNASNIVARKRPTNTVLVVGAAYGGHRAVQCLVTMLPEHWRVVVLDRNTHFNHLYAFPRVSVIKGHEQKVFIPYTKIFEPQSPLGSVTSKENQFIHGQLVRLFNDGNGSGSAIYTPLDADALPDSTTGRGALTKSIAFDYLVYGLGSHLPDPINIWSVPKNRIIESHFSPGTKSAGINWLQHAQIEIEKAKKIVVIGAGPLGVQFASDIAWLYGTKSSKSKWKNHQFEDANRLQKQITLFSSRDRLLPRFQPWMHQQAMYQLQQLGVDIWLNARADMSSLKKFSNDDQLQNKIIETIDGRKIEADLILFCTGQKPNVEFLQQGYGRPFGINVINSTNGAAYVTPALQLSDASRKVIPSFQNVFVIGDAADAFGALNAGHTAFAQANIAAKNVVTMIEAEEAGALKNPILEIYKPEPHKIKVSVGLDRAINENSGNHRIITDGGIKEDLNTPSMWTSRGLDTSNFFV